MTLQIIITAYILLLLGIIYLTWNYYFVSSKEEEIKQNIEVEEKSTDSFEGKKVVFDGKLDELREESIKCDLLSKNAIVEEKMAMDTNFLITGKNPDWLVVEEAKEHGITIVDEMDWQKAIKLNKSKFPSKNNLRDNTGARKVNSAEII
ncbi:BRCT domain-containing protein [Zunongwangia mangrovi]|nr:BRCT domain-containing protein [Zunongwangia mangrovi]